MAEPLLNDHGIGSIIIESPFCILCNTIVEQIINSVKNWSDRFAIH